MLISILTKYPTQIMLGAAIVGAIFLWWWRRRYCRDAPFNFQDGIQLGLLVFTVLSLALIVAQVEKNAQANLASVRGQLYATETSLGQAEFDDDKAGEGGAILFAVYSPVPVELEGRAYVESRLKVITTDSEFTVPPSAQELHALIYSTDPGKRKSGDLRALRRTFLHIQAIFYHMHNAHDYERAGIFSAAEWKTWNGYISEMGPHPILLSVIAQGHEHDYFSHEFGEFLQEALFGITGDLAPKQVAIRERNRTVIAFYYPAMLDSNWSKKLPHY